MGSGLRVVGNPLSSLLHEPPVLEVGGAPWDGEGLGSITSLSVF